MSSEGPPRGFLDLIDDLYQSVLDRKKWQELAIGIAGLFGAQSCALQAYDLDGRDDVVLSATGNLSEDAIREYVARYGQFEEWRSRALGLPHNRAWLGRELAVATPPEVNDYALLHRLGLRHLVGAVVAGGTRPLGIIGVHRDTHEFGEQSRQLMQILVPHLQRAFQLDRELAATRLKGAVGLDGLDRLAVAAIVVAADGRIVLTNDAALVLLRGGDGLAAAGGRIGATRPQAALRLQALIATAAGAADHPGRQLELPRRDRRPLTAVVSPLPPEGVGPAPSGVAMLLVRDPQQHGLVDAAALRTLFDLTVAEARLAAWLAEGGSIREFAAAHQVSPHTARTQLKRIMEKTATGRQSQLVALVLRSSALLRPA